MPSRNSSNTLSSHGQALPIPLDKTPFLVYPLSRAMHSKEGLTISQAAEAMGVSPKTIRRRIKKGEIASKLVPGKFGEEYRITELPSLNIQEQTLDITPTLDTTLALPIIRELHGTNLQLAGRLGIAQERIRTLEN